ncbi:MAG: carbohydrate-binding domain-containing protein [Clostridia bacterium]|nr:carbohydrate-binding domain-containing protein [Clostridia bacterium]
MRTVKRIAALGLSFALCAGLFCACGKQTENTDTNSAENTAQIPTLSALNYPEIADEDNEQVIDTANATVIAFAGDSATVTGAGASALGSTVTVQAAGTYLVTGSTENGQLAVKAPDTATVKLVLQNVAIQNPTSAAIAVENAGKVILNLPAGSVNTVSDGNAYTDVSDGAPDSAIYSKDDLTVNGAGTLRLYGNYNDALKSNDTLIITGGNLEIASADDGIIGKDFVLISGGNLQIDAAGDGIKSTYDTDRTKGAIAVSGGTLTVTAGADGLQAQTAVQLSDGIFHITTGGGSAAAETKTQTDFPMRGGAPGNETNVADTATETTDSYKGLKCGYLLEITGGTYTLDCADDGVHSNDTVSVSGGSLTIASGDDGIHADTLLSVTDGVIQVTESYEGLEGTQIDIAGGDISVTASDDGLNAAGGNDGSAENGRFGGDPFSGSSGTLNITGGTVYINASGDGLDSNGDVNQSGGTVVIDGPTNSGNGALDYGGTYNMTGGTVVAAGAAGMAMTISDSSSVYAVTVGANGAANTAVRVCDSDGNEVLAFVPQKAFQTVVIATKDFEKGETYTVSTAAYSGGTLQGGLLTGASYGSETAIGTFTANSILSSVGQTVGMQNGGMGGKGGAMGGQKPQGGRGGALQ